MTKWFEVKVTKVTVLAVEVKDTEGQDEAMNYAIDYVGDMDECDCSHEITDTSYLESIKRHADDVLTVDED